MHQVPEEADHIFVGGAVPAASWPTGSPARACLRQLWA